VAGRAVDRFGCGGGLVFEYAFISVWCFFAAVLTGLLCVMFYRLPHGSEAT
jgi:hypothetical protein